LRALPALAPDPNLLVNAGGFDDAGVYRLTADLAIVQTIDFFTPIVDDPFIFGQVAAANALSDVYAMGAKPLTCMNIAAFPSDKLPLSVLVEILRGGAERVQAAGATLVGGHTIVDNTPKFGMAVTGIVHPDRILTNAGGQADDVLLLTKPLGIGVVTTAIKRSNLPGELVNQAMQTMIALNAEAALAAIECGAHACTDVTGVGLLGHLHEMALASGLAARIHSATVPMLPGVLELTAAGFVCGGSRANLSYAARYTTFAPHVEPTRQLVLADAVTSGGLLVALPAEMAEKYQSCLAAKGVHAAVIGCLTIGAAGSISVV